MKKSVQLIVGGAIASFIGIIIMLIGFSKFKGVEGSLTTVVNGSQQGIIETTIGILFFVVGAFIAIHGFGNVPED